MEIAYTIRAVTPSDHRALFEIDLDGVTSPSVDLVLPSWVPGSYLIRNNSRGFRDFVARKEPGGEPLPVARVDKARWRIPTAGVARVHVEYTAYGHQLITEGFDVTPDHLYINAALCLPYVDDHLRDPVTVAFEVPAEWTVVTELEEVARSPPRFRARDYDELVDSPIDVGQPLVLTIHPKGIPHRISLCGEGANYDAQLLEQDVGKIVEAAIDLVGDSPLRRYTFLYHLTETHDGGLEHKASTSCVLNRGMFRPMETYRRFLSITAHEYLHLYNVKRIRPKVLGPFDYTRENYTRQLWWMEGTTDYFTYLVLRRAGLLSPEQYLKQRARNIKEYLEIPGRNRLSLEELSLIAWVDIYQPFEETPNQSVSYYLKGDLVSMCLDLEIRHQSEARSSLETVLRLLWNEYGKPGVGLEEDELLPVVNRATGLDLSGFFDRYVRGTDDLDLAAFALHAGLVLAPKPKDPDEQDETEAGDLGVALEEVPGGLARVRTSYVGRPGHAAGLTPGDEIVAINGSKVTYAGLSKTLEKFPAGTPAEITVFRRGYLHRVSLVTGSPPPAKYMFTPMEAAPERAQRVYESWMGAKWTPKPAAGPVRS